MPATSSILEWEIVLDDAEWDRQETLQELLPAPAQRESEPQPAARRFVTHRRGFVALMLVALVAGVLPLGLLAQRGAAAIEAEVQNAVEVELWAEEAGDMGAANSLVDRAADATWRHQYLREQELAATARNPGAGLEQALVERTRLRSDLAMVEVTVSGEEDGAYRETRFYRETPGGWVRTAPAPVFWGREHVLETEHFRIRYRQADAQAVTAAAQELDAIYEQLRGDLGLSGNATMLDVEVAPVTLAQLGYLHFRDGTLTVPSPLLGRMPVAVGNGAVLVQSIASPLVMQVWEQAATHEAEASWRDGARMWWHIMVRGVQIWQGAASSEPTARWYSAAVRWLLVEAPALRAGEREAPAVDRRTFCMGDSSWRANVPISFSPVPLCLDSQWKPALRYMTEAPRTLRQLLAVDEWDPRPLTENESFMTWQRSVAAATVVDYYVDAYGREALPKLVDGFRMHDSWETLIPAVAGVSAAEFEARWQRFLAVKYGYEKPSD